MAWDDGREELDNLIEHNKNCPPEEVIDEWHEWSSPDGGITWGNIDDKGNSVIYNPDGDEIVGNIYEETEYVAFDKKNYPIINIISRINDKTIIADPDYKRGLIWDERQQSRFIESLLLGLPVPPLFFETDDEGRWLAIDGTQRLMTLKRLFDNDLILSDLKLFKDAEARRFDNLPYNGRYVLEDYSIETILVDLDVSDEMKLALFERFNISGPNLSSQDLRNYRYRKTSFPLLRRLWQYIRNQKSIIFPYEKASHVHSDEFVLHLLSFYFIMA